VAAAAVAVAAAAAPFKVREAVRQAARDAVTARVAPMRDEAFEATAAFLHRLLDVTETK
jgi:hypothetical protein